MRTFCQIYFQMWCQGESPDANFAVIEYKLSNFVCD